MEQATLMVPKRLCDASLDEIRKGGGLRNLISNEHGRIVDVHHNVEENRIWVTVIWADSLTCWVYVASTVSYFALDVEGWFYVRFRREQHDPETFEQEIHAWCQQSCSHLYAPLISSKVAAVAFRDHADAALARLFLT